MRIVYSGVDLGVLETLFYAHDAVLDDSGTDYLYTRVAGRVKAQVNGQARVTFPVGDGSPGGFVPGQFRNGPFLSYAFDPASPPPPSAPNQRPDPTQPVANSGGLGIEPAATGVSLTPRSALRRIVPVSNAPPLTIQTVRQRLCTPRGQLFVFAGPGVEAGVVNGAGDTLPGSLDLLMAQAPNPGFACDCRNGPVGKVLAVTAAFGDANTLVVEWEFEAYINEADTNGVAATGALLSNRFAQTQIVDADGYTTTVTGGAAVFRTDLLYQTLQSPDANRPLLFMPVPPGCVRENVEVRGLPDATGVAYGYRDRQVPVNFPAGPQARAASISALHRQAISATGDLFGGMLAAYERIQGIRANRRIAQAAEEEAKKQKAAPVSPRPGVGNAINGFLPGGG